MLKKRGLKRQRIFSSEMLVVFRRKDFYYTLPNACLKMRIERAVYIFILFAGALYVGLYPCQLQRGTRKYRRWQEEQVMDTHGYSEAIKSTQNHHKHIHHPDSHKYAGTPKPPGNSHGNATVTSITHHPGYYINLTYYDPDDKHVQIVEHICIQRVDKSSNLTELVIYNARFRINKYTKLKDNIMAYAYGGPRFIIPWHVLKKRKPIPKRLKKVNQTLFLYFEKYPDNFFHFIHDSFIGLFGVMQRLGRLNAPEGNHVLRRDCSPVKQDIFREFIDKLSPNIHFGDCIMRSTVKDVCFRHGVAGFIQPDPRSFTDFVLKSFDADGPCSSPLIVFLDRSERRIKNIHQLADAVRQLDGIGDNNVQVVKFETITLKQQVQMIACTRLLIGVQGAGMYWHVFQPAVAAVLELGWTNWPAFMYTDLAQKRGLYADFLETKQVDIDTSFFRLPANMTESEKRNVINLAINAEDPTAYNPYKHGNGTFDVKIFQRKVKKLTGLLREKGVVFS